MTEKQNLLDRAQINATFDHPRMGKTPVLTELLYKYSRAEQGEFERLCELIALIQAETLRLALAEGVTHDKA